MLSNKCQTFKGLIYKIRYITSPTKNKANLHVTSPVHGLFVLLTTSHFKRQLNYIVKSSKKLRPLILKLTKKMKPRLVKYYYIYRFLRALVCTVYYISYKRALEWSLSRQYNCHINGVANFSTSSSFCWPSIIIFFFSFLSDHSAFRIQCRLI